MLRHVVAAVCWGILLGFIALVLSVQLMLLFEGRL